MSIFTIVIDRRAVFAFAAGTFGEAAAFAARPSLHRELAAILSGGRPLWYPAANLSVRPAVAEEAIHWRSSFETGVSLGEILTGESNFGVFLVNVSVPG